ncbi:MAG: rhomboid family intramembrane serine protease [Paracoccaceae bacterium]
MRMLRAAPVTFSLIGLCLLGYAAHGNVVVARAPVPLGEVFLNVFNHGSLLHLVGNLALLGFAGPIVERILGPRRMLALVAACIVVGTLAQLVMVGPRFVGISGPVYGVIGFAVLATAPRVRWWGLSMIAMIALALEATLLSTTLALYPHILSTFLGGGFAMFNSLFGSKSPTLKPMQLSHLSKVIAIINETDEDDAAEAEEQFLGQGCGGMYVLAQGNEVLGVTGYSPDEQVPDVVWLSWTYLRGDRTGEGLGGQMLNDLLGMLKDHGVRKMFIATSDYAENGTPIYAAAHEMYEEFGAEVEMSLPDYHDIGEAKIVYGLENPEYEAAAPAAPHENTGIAVTGSAPEPETDGVLGLTWTEAPVGLAGLDFAVDKARESGARMLVIALPSDLSDENAETLKSHQFDLRGSLEDYYALGLHQHWWVCLLSSN